METNVRIALGLAQKSDSETESFAYSVINGMARNPDFPQPTNPTLEQLVADTDAFKDALAAAASGGKVQVLIKNQKRKVLENTLKKMADYVELSGDVIKITAAGFPVSVGKTNRLLGAANGLDVTVGGNAGEAILEVGKIDNALSYFAEFAISPAQGEQRIHRVAKSRKVVLSNLKSLTPYDFIGGAVGSNGQVVYTEIITKTVL
ncbi:MAG: hypothetical protein QM726_14425 [Chitinophagaceae bacterium]